MRSWLAAAPRLLGAGLAAALLAPAASAAGQGTLSGTVRNGIDSLPLPGVTVAVVSGGERTSTAADGSYRLDRVSAGTHEVRFSRPGFAPLTVTVLVGGGVLVLETFLEPLPVRIAPVTIVSQAPDSGSRTDAAEGPARLGGWSAGAQSLGSRTGAGDAIRAVSMAPAAELAPEAASGLHVRGGSADQTLVLLDGIPLENALHSGEVLSGVNPDALAAATLRGGAPSAAYGGRLSGIVDLRTAPLVGSRPVVRLAVGTAGSRAMLAAPLVRDRASLLVSARRGASLIGVPSVAAEGAEGTAPNAWSDLLAVAAARIGDDSVRVVGLRTADALAFSGVLGRPIGEAAADPPADAGGSAAAETVGMLPNSMAWRSTTAGVTWRHPSPLGVIRSMAWRSTSDANIGWSGPRGRVAMSSRVVHSGVAVSLALAPAGRTRAGLQVEDLHPRYAVAPESAGIPPMPDCLAGCPTLLDGRLRVGSIFAERDVGESAGFGATVGARAVIAATADIPLGRAQGATAGRTPMLEPRISVHARPASWLELALGYARTHQYVQSVWNEESPVEALAGLDVLAPAGAGGLPIARADALTASARLVGHRRSNLSIDWYARKLGGLASPALAGPAPFATGRIALGEVTAWGIGVSGDRSFGRLSLAASWAYSHVVHEAGAIRYQPAFAPTHRIMADAAYRVDRRTTVRILATGESGRRATPVSGPFGWRWRGWNQRRRDVQGDPGTYAGSLGSAPLPDYARLDIGVEREIPVAYPVPSSLTAFLRVDNVLGRANTFGYTADANGARVPLPMLPRSFTAGVGWRF